MIVPLASPIVQGRLGVAQLPRLWLTGVLAQADLLAPGYAVAYEGLTKIALDGVGLSLEDVVAKLRELPDYQQFEAWVRGAARHLDASSITTTNAALEADPRSLAEALDDWERVHADVVARRGTKIEQILPAVSQQARGPLGLMHLPRLWMKATLNACNALYEGWRSGRVSGFDVWFTSHIGLDLDGTIAYIHAELPSYPEFERWAIEHAERARPSDVAGHNAIIRKRVKPDAVAAEERAQLGLDEPGYNPSIELNDLVDWHYLHADVIRHIRHKTAIA